MSLVVTDAIVLHAFDYLESSRILRLVTREVGVRSVLARGARRSSRRFGSSLDLYTQGSAQLEMKIGRDLDTLAGFDGVRGRPQLAAQLARFTGASAIAELILRFAGDAVDPELFDTVVRSLDDIAIAPPDRVRDVTLAAAWRILRGPRRCPDYRQLRRLSRRHRARGAVDVQSSGGRRALRALRTARAWRTKASRRGAPRAAALVVRRVLCTRLTTADVRAHQRLLREFLREHLADDRPLRAFDVWERDAWTGGAA